MQSPTELDVVSAKEAWSEYRLADGTILRIKPVVISISRMDETRTPDGQPVYTMRSTLIMDARSSNL